MPDGSERPKPMAPARLLMTRKQRGRDVLSNRFEKRTIGVCECDVDAAGACGLGYMTTLHAGVFVIASKRRHLRRRRRVACFNSVAQLPFRS
jgi:hypothetical protein